ncbi:MAG: ATP-binding protein [Myxococcota bacterium]
MLALGFVIAVAWAGTTEPSLVRLEVPEGEVVELRAGWRRRVGDTPSWAFSEDEPDAWEELDDTMALSGVPDQAWYHLTVDVPSKLTGRPIYISPVHIGAVEIFVDGERIFREGSIEAAVGSGPVPFQNHHLNATSYTFRTPGPHLIAVRHGSRMVSFLSWLGVPSGFRLKIGRPEAVTALMREHGTHGLSELWFTGVSFTVALLHLFLFFFRRQSREYLYFAVTSFGLGVIALSNRISNQLADLHFTLVFFTTFRVALIWVSYSFYRFILTLCGSGRHRTRPYLALSLVGTVFVFVLPLFTVYTLSSVLMVEAAVLLVIGIRDRVPGAVGVAIGGGFGCVGAALQLFPTLLGYGDPDGPQYYLYGFCGTYVVVSLLLARNYAKAHEDLSFQMERAMSQERRAQEEQMARKELEVENALKEQQLDEARQREAMLAELEEAYRELRTTQAQLVQSGKMAALGQLVAGVAHEINTPVGAVASMHQSMCLALDKIDQALDEDEGLRKPEIQKGLGVLREAASVIGSGSERVSKIVRRLRTFARLDEAEFKRADVNEGIRDTLLLVQHKRKTGIEISCDLDEKLPLVPCFPSQLNQVFLNLLVNAVQAIEPPGLVKTATRSDEGWVCVRIEDTGRGIPPEHLERIFDPGFTTKGVRVGTGLGLSISYQIIQEHQGRIEVESRVGEGTSFEVWLPLDLEARLNRSAAG